MYELLKTLKEIAESGLPFRFEILDDSAATGRAYLDLIDTDDTDASYRLELLGPENL